MKFKSETTGDKTFRTAQVTRLDLRGKILDLEDTVSYVKTDKGDFFEKIVLNCVDYGSTPSISIRHYLDLDDFMALAYDIFNVKQVDYKDFKGSASDKYPTGFEARTLTVASWADGDRGKGAFTFAFAAGSGTKSELGAVSLSGKPTKEIKLVVTIPEAKRFFLSGFNYFNAKLSAALLKNWEEFYPGK